MRSSLFESQILSDRSLIDEALSVATGVLVLCAATVVAYAVLRIGYAGDGISAGTYNFASNVVLSGSVLGGALIAGVLGYERVSILISVLLGLAPVVGICLGSLVTVALGIGYYDSGPASFFHRPPSVLFRGERNRMDTRPSVSLIARHRSTSDSG
jgi:hypothetical protein